MPQGRGRDRRDTHSHKPIDTVREAHKDLVEVVQTLRQVVCVKG